MKIVCEISDSVAKDINAVIIRANNSDGNTHGTLGFETLTRMLLEDVAMAVTRVAQAARTKAPARYHYKNWSIEFECPICARRGWFSKNFLGQRVVFCDGIKFTKVKTYADKRKLDRAYALAIGDAP